MRRGDERPQTSGESALAQTRDCSLDGTVRPRGRYRRCGTVGAMRSPAPWIDDGVRRRLTARFEPGTPLLDSPTYPRLASVAELLTSLHATGVPDPSYPTLAHRVAHLFDSGTKPYNRRPELAEIVPPQLYEHGRRLAAELLKDVSPTALLHGDLTPVNVLDGGDQRRLVAIDPAPCLGDDLAYEAIDLLLWQADDADLIAARAQELAPAIDVDARRLLDWCIACAGMVA